MSPFSYLVQQNEPCIVVEVLVPKKAHLQGVLYQALTDGFKLEQVRRHFLNAGPEERRRINELIGKGWTILQEPYAEAEFEAFPRLFYGYSMYEVDGVYLREKPEIREVIAPVGPRSDADEDSNYEIVEERTLVVRLVFRYPCSDRSLEVIDFCKASLRDPFSDVLPFEKSHPHFVDAMTPEVVSELQNLDRWVRNVGLFLFGFILFNVCEEILRQDEADDPQKVTPGIRQDEIWVCSFWNMVVNSVRWSSASSESRSTESGWT